jgi:copper chaperone
VSSWIGWRYSRRRKVRRRSSVSLISILLRGELMQVFNVQGMSCQHCVAAITRAVQALDSAARVQVDLPAGRVSIESVLAEAELLRVLADEGYAAQRLQGL